MAVFLRKVANLSKGLKPTSWRFIRREFSHLIEETRELRDSTQSEVKVDIVFRDMSKLKCKEYIKNGYISVFQYDLYDGYGNVIMKFHSEPHEDEESQTDTEPFHMHIKKDEKDYSASVRKALPVSLRTIEGILILVENSANLKYLYKK